MPPRSVLQPALDDYRAYWGDRLYVAHSGALDHVPLSRNDRNFLGTIGVPMELRTQKFTVNARSLLEKERRLPTERYWLVASDMNWLDIGLQASTGKIVALKGDMQRHAPPRVSPVCKDLASMYLVQTILEQVYEATVDTPIDYDPPDHKVDMATGQRLVEQAWRRMLSVDPDLPRAYQDMWRESLRFLGFGPIPKVNRLPSTPLLP